MYRVAPAENSGLEPRSIDVVTVAQALHWFDLERFYNEVDRVLKDGGVLAAWGYGVLSVEGEPINEIALRLHNETLGPYWPGERKIVESGYRTLPFPLNEITPPPFELTVQWPLERLLGYFRSWSATGRYVAKHNVDPVEAVGEELARHWGDPLAPRQINWPLALRVSRKTVGAIGIESSAR
jgi:SAM-dependent methyltransferase